MLPFSADGERQRAGCRMCPRHQLAVPACFVAERRDTALVPHDEKECVVQRYSFGSMSVGVLHMFCRMQGPCHQRVRYQLWQSNSLARAWCHGISIRSALGFLLQLDLQRRENIAARTSRGSLYRQQIGTFLSGMMSLTTQASLLVRDSSCVGPTAVCASGPPDPSKWSFELGDSGWGNGELQFYTDSPKNAYVSDGCLRIRALLQKCGSRDFTSSRLTTLGKNDWQHGRFEARVRLPCGRGTWAGIWMMPTSGEPWPTGGEIDIVEHVGHDAGRIHGTVHTALCNHQQASQVGGILPLSVDLWHTYGIEWNAERIDFHCDGFRYFRIRKDP